MDQTVPLHGPVALSLLTRPRAVEEDVGSPPLFTVGSPAQAPAYYYYTAADDSTYGYDDSAYAYGSDDAYGHAQCLNQMVAARCATAESRPPRHRRDASSMAWRRGLSPLDSACATAFSPRKDLVKNYRAQPTHRFARRLCGG